jgi:hypothetical protein
MGCAPLRPFSHPFHIVGGERQWHESRLNRDLAHPFGSDGYAKEELRAEIASMILGDELGIGRDPGQHAAYVGSWIKTLRNDHTEIFRASSDAEKIQNYVLAFERKRVHEGSDAPRITASDIEQYAHSDEFRKTHEALQQMFKSVGAERQGDEVRNYLLSSYANGEKIELSKDLEREIQKPDSGLSR